MMLSKHIAGSALQHSLDSLQNQNRIKSINLPLFFLSHRSHQVLQISSVFQAVAFDALELVYKSLHK